MVIATVFTLGLVCGCNLTLWLLKRAAQFDGPEVHQHTMVTDDDGHQWCAHCDAQFDGCQLPDDDAAGSKLGGAE